jgi:ubiquinone/menaquinone biosynthesis C-methylase UbiE
MSTPVDWNAVYRKGAQWDVSVPSHQIQMLLDVLGPHSTVLDAGCGNGRNLAAIAAGGHFAVGIDTADEALIKARDMAPMSCLVRADIRSLPFPDRSFAGIYAGYVLQHLDMESACRELSRVLKPGSPCLFVILELTKHSGFCPYDVEIPHDAVISAIAQAFEIRSEGSDSYEEADEYGHHIHRRATLLCSNPVLQAPCI